MLAEPRAAKIQTRHCCDKAARRITRWETRVETLCEQGAQIALRTVIGLYGRWRLYRGVVYGRRGSGLHRRRNSLAHLLLLHASRGYFSLSCGLGLGSRALRLRLKRLLGALSFRLGRDAQFALVLNRTACARYLRVFGALAS